MKLGLILAKGDMGRGDSGARKILTCGFSSLIFSMAALISPE